MTNWTLCVVCFLAHFPPFEFADIARLNRKSRLFVIIYPRACARANELESEEEEEFEVGSRGRMSDVIYRISKTIRSDKN